MSMMMESIALSESHVVDDIDFVIVETEDMDIDEEDYDYCEDIFSTTSPVPSSSAFSPSSSFDMETLMEENETSTVVSIDEDDIEDADDITVESAKAIHHEDEPNTPPINEDNVQDETPDVKKYGIRDNNTDEDAKTDFITTSRLSNKKRRKKLKLMKKAAAAAAAAAAVASGNMSPTKSRVPPPPKPKGQKSKSSRSSSKKRVSNVAVACATESLAAFRKEHNIKPKQGSSSNYVAFL